MDEKLNLENLEFTEPISFEESVKDIVPLDLPEDVLNGSKKIEVVSSFQMENKKCAKLGILYKHKSKIEE